MSLLQERTRRYARQLLGALSYCHDAQLVVHTYTYTCLCMYTALLLLLQERTRRYARQLLGALSYCHDAQLVVHTYT